MDEITLRLILLGVESIVLLPLIVALTYLGIKDSDSDWFVGGVVVALIYIIAAAATLFAKG